MKYLIPILVGIASTTAAVTTALAQAHGALIGGAWLKPPYVYGYVTAAILMLIAILAAIHTGRQEKKATTEDAHKLDSAQVNTEFAELLKQDREIYVRLVNAHVGAEFSTAMASHAEWVNRVINVLRNANLPTDAEIFRQTGNAEPSPEQLARTSGINWKRRDLAKVAIYRSALDQIIANRRL